MRALLGKLSNFFRGTATARSRGFRGYQVLRIEKVPQDTMEMFNQLVEGTLIDIELKCLVFG